MKEGGDGMGWDGRHPRCVSREEFFVGFEMFAKREGRKGGEWEWQNIVGCEIVSGLLLKEFCKFHAECECEC